MAIRIIAAPEGDAPLEIRQEWVGLVLPTESDEPVLDNSFGLISLKDKGERLVYVVLAREAFRVLGEHKPEVLQWWQDHVPSIFSMRHNFHLTFVAEACEVVAEEPAVPA